MNCMATLKHIASKNSDYTAIEAYLVYQHDAFTGKQLLDEQGKPKLRDSYLLGVRTAGIEVPCKLVEVGAHLAALGKQGGNSGQGFFSTACNDDCFLNLDVVDGTADKGGEGEIQEFASEFQ